jgi:hypothetical protein
MLKGMVSMSAKEKAAFAEGAVGAGAAQQQQMAKTMVERQAAKAADVRQKLADVDAETRLEMESTMENMAVSEKEQLLKMTRGMDPGAVSNTMRSMEGMAQEQKAVFMRATEAMDEASVTPMMEQMAGMSAKEKAASVRGMLKAGSGAEEKTVLLKVTEGAGAGTAAAMSEATVDLAAEETVEETVEKTVQVTEPAQRTGEERAGEGAQWAAVPGSLPPAGAAQQAGFPKATAGTAAAAASGTLPAVDKTRGAGSIRAADTAADGQPQTAQSPQVALQAPQTPRPLLTQSPLSAQVSRSARSARSPRSPRSPRSSSGSSSRSRLRHASLPSVGSPATGAAKALVAQDYTSAHRLLGARHQRQPGGTVPKGDAAVMRCLPPVSFQPRSRFNTKPAARSPRALRLDRTCSRDDRPPTSLVATTTGPLMSSSNEYLRMTPSHMRPAACRVGL